MSSIREELFKELLQKVVERQARLDKKERYQMSQTQENEKFQKIWDLVVEDGQVDKYKNTFPTPKDNERRYYRTLRAECEMFFQRNVRQLILYAIDRKFDEVNIVNAEKYIVSYAVKMLKTLGYTVIHDVYQVIYTDSCGIKRNTYLAKIKLF